MKTDIREDIPTHESPEMIKLISELSDLEIDDKFRSMMMDFYKKESEK